MCTLRRGWRLGAPVAVTTKLPLMPQELGLLPGLGSLGVKEDHSEVLFVGSSVFPSCWRQESSLAFRCSKQTARPVEVQTWDQLSLGHLPQADHTGLRLTDGKLA